MIPAHASWNHSSHLRDACDVGLARAHNIIQALCILPQVQLGMRSCTHTINCIYI